MKLIDFLTRTFTWWNGQTWGTYWYTRRKGERVGHDDGGNIYYRAMGPLIDPSTGPERRWVIFAGETDASRIPPEWRSWLTHTHDIPPSQQSYKPRDWQKPHLPNMTGTAAAYHPPGSAYSPGGRGPASADYVAWSPDGAVTGAGDVPSPEPHPGTHGADARQTQRG